MAYFVQRRRSARGVSTPEWPHVALRDDARHVLFRGSLQPDAHAAVEKHVVGGGRRDQAAAGSDHGTLVLVQHALERSLLEAAESVLPVHREHFSELGAG